MKRILFALLVVCVSLGATCAYGDDLYPPPWRGLPGTTYQLWTFPNSAPAPLPDVAYNQYGVPSAQVWPGTGQVWWDVWGGRQGVWPLSGAIELYIPNRPFEGAYKDIWIQLTWAKQAFASVPILSTMPQGSVELLRQVDIGPTNEPPPAGANWWHSTYNIRIYPNPSFETIRIDGTIMVDQIVVDTICIPEPGSLAAMLTGLAGVIGFASRKRR